MAWYYQTSPHDTHDWDSTQTPVLADMPINGRMRKLVLTASRNGYYFTLDRLTGEHIVTGKVSDAVNWPPPSFSPDTGLFWAMYYLTETDPRGAMGLGGKQELGLGAETFLTAIDYKTANTVWRHKYPSVGGAGGTAGLLTTAGKLLFARRGRKFRGVRSGERRSAVAHAHRRDLECSSDLHGRRSAVYPCGDRRHALDIHVVPMRHFIDDETGPTILHFMDFALIRLQRAAATSPRQEERGAAKTGGIPSLCHQRALRRSHHHRFREQRSGRNRSARQASSRNPRQP